MEVQRDKMPLAGLGKGAALVLAGVIIGAIGVLITLMLHRPDQSELKASMQQYTVKYVKSEQVRLGIDCHALRKTLQGFLIDNVNPALRSSKPGQNWMKNFSQDTRKRMGELHDYYFACGKLYHMAQSIQWDEFKDMEYVEKLDREIITLNTLIRFGDTEENFDATHLDMNFRVMQDAVNSIERSLNRGDK